LSQLDGKYIAGRYEIREHIATGGMASVYKTWDRQVERDVAIKILRNLDKTDPHAVERFRREARAAAALSHPNAVTIFDFVEEENQYYLVMEYINGPTLKQVIGKFHQLPPRLTLDIAAQVCDVLQVAHSRRFIHRDIKPQNIMLMWNSGSNLENWNGKERPLIKLTDFGIVRVLEESGLTKSGIVLGTADYLSPEQARGETLTDSSDLYSLGVVMFEMLAGRPPFVGPTAVSIAMQHASTLPPSLRAFNPAVPPSVEGIVMKTLQKEPRNRFRTAAEMQLALRQCARELARAAQQARDYPRPSTPNAPLASDGSAPNAHLLPKRGPFST
jgi:serine/threonine protein kinase